MAERAGRVGLLEYRRFNAFHRWMHFLAMVSFSLLVFTGMPLKYKNAAWAQWVMDAVGGVATAGLVHRVAALVTVVYFVLEIAYIAWFVVLRRGPIRGPGTILPAWKDLRDIVDMFRWFFRRGPFPQFDRYTYWEKFDFWSLMAGTVIIGATGFMMWFPVTTTRYLAGIFLNVALVIHSNEALLAMGVIFIFVHLFSAHGRPGSFPVDKVIFTGSVPADHYRHERPLEYARRVREGTLDEVLVPPRTAAGEHTFNAVSYVVTAVALVAAALMTVFIIWTVFS